MIYFGALPFGRRRACFVPSLDPLPAAQLRSNQRPSVRGLIRWARVRHNGLASGCCCCFGSCGSSSWAQVAPAKIMTLGPISAVRQRRVECKLLPVGQQAGGQAGERASQMQLNKHTHTRECAAPLFGPRCEQGEHEDGQPAARALICLEARTHNAGQPASRPAASPSTRPLMDWRRLALEAPGASCLRVGARPTGWLAARLADRSTDLVRPSGSQARKSRGTRCAPASLSNAPPPPPLLLLLLD